MKLLQGRTHSVSRIGMVLVILVGGLWPTSGLAQPRFEWLKRVASTSSDDEFSMGSVVDSAGNVYITGWFEGANDFGGVTLTAAGGVGTDSFVAKYLPTGELHWVRRGGGGTSEQDEGRGVGVDDAGNVYLTGAFHGAADFDGIPLTGSTETLFFLAKYNSEGAIQWARQSEGGAGVYGTGAAVDRFGNSYIVGYSDNGADVRFGSINLSNPALTGYSAFLAKYDTDGSVQWAQLMGGSGQTYATKVAVDSAGNVYVRGSFSSDFSVGTTNLTSLGGNDIFVCKLSPAGALLWIRRAGGAGAVATGDGGVAVDLFGNVHISGAFDGAVRFDNLTLTSAGGPDAFVAKYDSLGNVLWARQTGGSGLEIYFDLALDTRGNVYAAGATAGNPSGNDTAVIAKYDPDGVHQWTLSGTSPHADPVGSLVTKLSVSASGNCYLAGVYRESITFDSHSLSQAGPWNFFLASLSGLPRPPKLSGTMLADGVLQLSIEAMTGDRWTIQASPDLVTWNPVADVTHSAPLLQFSDASSKDHPHRFYRLIPGR